MDRGGTPGLQDRPPQNRSFLRAVLLSTPLVVFSLDAVFLEHFAYGKRCRSVGLRRVSDRSAVFD